MWLVSFRYRSNDLVSKIWLSCNFFFDLGLKFFEVNVLKDKTRPSGMALLEGSFCEKIISPVKGKDTLCDKQTYRWKVNVIRLIMLGSGEAINKMASHYISP
ncbi:hypothetical protein HELRODRAFT_174900 [Helobdella robusta]|uniref:Uncharacterized protein n=1 Tax=Helobdella robusta TaxID=6412 RepID=T1F8L5_HELRO|nr:hypothetical protein HELRODRAFT_174900 [Helobdella robusta]ESO01344.1 hypothetical protein HELRODRAFT_174900 [Helobdella robusta]